MGLFLVLCSVFLLGAAVPAWSEKHSLYYIYTALSKPVQLPGIYQFTAMGLLDDREIDYYNSHDQRKIPKQHWMKEKMQEDYWEKGTQSRKSKEQWFNVNVDILMKRMRHNESDVHVLQWRHGCEIERQGDEVKFSKGIDEYSYDGENFLSFDDKESQWVAPVDAAVPTKRKWDKVPILNQYTKGYLEKECVDWLNKFRDYGEQELRESSPPDVHVFAKRCTTDKNKVKLTCLATGFYPKDVILSIRKYRSPLPEDEIESSRIRPNHDGTYQLRKSVIIQEDEKAEYDCFVKHRTLKEPIIITWDGKCQDCTKETILGMVIGAVIGVVLMLAVGALVYFLRRRKNIAGQDRASNRSSSSSTGSQNRVINCVNLSELPNTAIAGSQHSSDSGKGSAGPSPDDSPTNSQEAVNLVSEASSGQSSPAEAQSLLQQSSELYSDFSKYQDILNIIKSFPAMATSVATASFALLCVFLLCGTSSSVQTEKHSLYYIYTALSKPVDLPGIYQFTAMGLLDDREIDYYNNHDQRKIPKQHWMKEKMQEDYWEKGTQSRKSKEQWFNVNVDILMKRMRHNESDVHVLQWRHGCEIEKQGSEVNFSKGIDEYSYDGENFLSFDDKESQWVAPVDAAVQTKNKWDKVPILNQYTKGYLEKECVDWLNKFRDYGDKELRKGSPPDVHVFAKRSTKDKTKLKLTCLATGFYPKDVILSIRKYRTSLSEDEIESSGVRPNHDGTYQLRKSVDIPKDEKAEYDCFVFHRTLKEPIITRWDGMCPDCGGSLVIGIAIGAVLVGIVAALVILYLYKTKRLICRNQSETNGAVQGNPANGVIENLLPGHNSNGHAPTAANGGPNGVKSIV
ncbi:uncharacterized protein LOC107717719 [Sinocyclocheilus rhinocerous]|uniref:uncharacterized protein LOC107717719 n=1 Tax=Sinocyclocheilus rhinocerous TaxID=307959 RepID=UPI0007BA509D|nr:PREDICTED: uncharacterized protein LOC107717719 [Sinocyclocheilus rhinocerous]